MERSVPDYGWLRCTIPFLLRQKGGWCNVGRLASLGGPLLLAGGIIVANLLRDLVGSVGRAELGRGAAARGWDFQNGVWGNRAQKRYFVCGGKRATINQRLRRSTNVGHQ